MDKKYLIIAKARGTTDGFVPADYLSDTRQAALDDIEKFHKDGLNGEPEWPVHTIIEVEIGPAAFNCHRPEFPDYDDDFPALVAQIEGAVDMSWHNDTCPKFHITIGGHVLEVFCDWLDPKGRDIPGCKRFHVYVCTADGDPLADRAILETNDLEEVKSNLKACVVAGIFSAWCYKNLTKVERDQIRAGDKSPDDFCDSNMPMAEAVETVTGHPLLPDEGEPSDEDCALWNAAAVLLQRCRYAL